MNNIPSKKQLCLEIMDSRGQSNSGHTNACVSIHLKKNKHKRTIWLKRWEDYFCRLLSVERWVREAAEKVFLS